MLAFLPILAASCGPGGGGGGNGGDGGSTASSSSSSSSGGGDLKWYTTCGAPVCGGTPAPTPLCTTEKEGEPCTEANQQCGIPNNDCGMSLLCATSDPTAGGCPISLSRYKHDIRYLPDSELKRVHDEILATPLATWRYNHEGAAGREHLGFIIDDNPKSPAVAESGQHVDLYGYTSMAVAAVQVQQKQIDALEQQIKALREELRAARGVPADPRASRRTSKP